MLYVSVGLLLYTGHGMSRMTYGWRLLLLYNALSQRGASPAHPSGSGRPSLI